MRAVPTLMARAQTPEAHIATMRGEVRSSAQDRPGIYRMMSSDGEILYIGKSKRVVAIGLAWAHGSRYAGGNSAEVSRVGLTDLGRELVRRMDAAGLVHDLGRVAVENGIWDKPGPLGAGERERVRLHPYLNERMMQQAPALAPLITGVRLPDPSDVLPLDDGAVLSLAGVDLTVRHAPGHTQGATIWMTTVEDEGRPNGPSIGRSP